MIDTHAHIYAEEFQEDLEKTIQRAQDCGIEKILMPNIDAQSIDPMMDLEKAYPDLCYPMMGLHPCYVKEDYLNQLKVIERWFETRKFLAVGEIGTDLYWDKTFWSQQQEAFHFQCKLALKYNLPIVIHSRDSIDETIDMVMDYVDQGLRGVFHCFTGTVEQATRITGMGFYLGLGGVSTFKNGGLDKVIPYLDKTKIVLETDAPYLAPAPNRGKRNEPSYLSLIAERVAGYLEISVDDLVSLTTRNANSLFFPNE